jgi:hypothetical protein
MPFFSKLFGSDAKAKARKQADLGQKVAPPKPKWEEAWARTEVAPEEVHELIHICTHELKSRGGTTALPTVAPTR